MSNSSSPLTAEAFLGQGRGLNLGGFTNLEKAEEAPLEKGLSDSLSRGDTKVLVNKTGKEVKEKLSTAYTVMLAQIKERKTKMEDLMKTANCLPDRALDHYELGDAPAEFHSIKSYGWEKCSYDDKSQNHLPSPDGINSNSTAGSKEQADACRLYNDIVRELVRTAADAHKTDVMIRNLKDNATYSLNVDQLAALGF